MTHSNHVAELYIRRGYKRQFETDTPEQRARVRAEKWEAIGGALLHGPSDARLKVHPIALKKTCQSNSRQCCYLQTGSGGRNNCSKCGWYGDDTRAPYKRPLECINDARNGRIDELETDASS